MHTAYLNKKGAALFGAHEPGQYLLTNANAGEALAMGYAEAIHHYESNDPQSLADNPLIVRSGGYGDLLMLTNVLAALADLNPTVACFPQFAPVLRDVGCKVIPYPIPLSRLTEFSQIISLEDVIETNPERHAVDAYCQFLGLDSKPHRKPPLYRVTAAELQEAKSRFPRQPNERRMALQFQASAACRTWPATQQHEFIRMALDDGWTIMLMGSPGSWHGNKHPRLINITQQTPPVTFTENAAILATCDVAVTPDSALTHMAAAIGLPTVTLYGPFHWRHRTRDYSSVRAIQGTARCAPCSHHVRGGIQFPESGPCAMTGFCYAMASITPERVLHTANKLHQAVQTALKELHP